MSETKDPHLDPKDMEWPNSFRTREELDAMLEEGLASGIAPENGLEIFKQILKRLKDG